jgi:hypothetical protein
MARVTLYAYATGKDLEQIATMIEERLDALVAERTWVSKDVWVVNQREPPDWDLGINLEVPMSKRPKRWTDDAVAIATTLAALHKEIGQTFVIGIHDAKSDATKDVFTVDGQGLDSDALREVLERSVAGLK